MYLDAHIPKDEKKKMDPKAKKIIFLRYGTCIKGHWKIESLL